MFRWVASADQEAACEAIALGRRSERRDAAVRRSGWPATAAVVLAIALSACSPSATTPPTEGGSDAADAAAGSDVDAATSGPDAVQGDGKGSDAGVQVPVTEEFWVLYGRRGKVAGADGVYPSDLVLANWLNPGLGNNSALNLGASPYDASKPALELTKHTLKANSLSCTHGCVVSQDLKYMTIALGAPGASGFTWRIGLLNEKLEVFLKFKDIEKAAHLQFAGGYLFYSTAAKCLATGKCQYDIHRIDLTAGGGAKDEILTRMAPDNDHDVTDNDTTYNGYFLASEDGSTIVFLSTTIRSVKIYAWRGGNLSKLDYVCASPIGDDKCVGTGSEYRDDDKAAVSADGKTIVLFTIVDRWLRARKYKVGSEEAPEFSNLVEIPSGGAYLQTVCPVIKAKPWQHADVKGQPQFSADGKDLYFLGYSNCGTKSDKPWTDIMALPLAKIGSTIGQADWRNLTNNPRDNSTKNKRIFDFSMSPKRQVFVISATAAVDQSGKPIPDGQKRAMDDPEVYTMNVGGANAGAPVWVPITNEVSYAADAPRTVLTVKAP